ncbi:MAG: hypothetical protein KDD55_00960 [Bdellovibrionales bacterium]|nr:hypothetical protein [Bdellovibrionales bacterium]
MPKSWFSQEASKSLMEIPSGATIHVIGVCGVAMGQLAVELSQQGYRVTGSDKEFYHPMAAILEDSSVETFSGYTAENIPPETALVVIGNSVPYENVEVQEVERRALDYTFFPKLLAESLIGESISLVIAGTHGKSTTTALTAHLLRSLSYAPSYFIGGQVRGFERSLHKGSGGVSVVEGDEYDSAFFAKVPKFSFYKPSHLVINAIEYDHADIYASLDDIKKEFRSLVTLLPPGGTLLCSADDEGVCSLLSEWKAREDITVITFGFSTTADVTLRTIPCEGSLGYQVHCSRSEGDFEFHLPLLGEYNAKNALAALLLVEIVGGDLQQACHAVGDFGGVVRRQQVHINTPKVFLVEDFAHHPTAVQETVSSMKRLFPHRRLLAVFEPRSNTSRQEIFREDYLASFVGADCVVLREVAARRGDEDRKLMDVQELSRELDSRGIRSFCYSDADQIADFVLQERQDGDVILVMSNGSFEGLVQKLCAQLQ